MRTGKRPRINRLSPTCQVFHYNRVVRTLAAIYDMAEHKIRRIYKQMQYDLRATQQILNCIKYESETN